MINDLAYEDGRLDALEKYFKTAAPMPMRAPAIPRPGWQPPTARPPMAGAPQVSRASVGAANAQARAAGNPIAAAPMQPIPVDRAAAGAKNMRQRGAPMPGATTTTPAPAAPTQPAATTQPAAGAATSTGPKNSVWQDLKAQAPGAAMNMGMMMAVPWVIDKVTGKPTQQQFDN